MATRPFNGNYLTLEDVRISYDKRSDTVHITSKDEDLTKDSNFKLSLNNGKSSDVALRKLLSKHGLMPPLETVYLPSGIKINLHDRVGITDFWHVIPLGLKYGGSELVWNPMECSNLFIYGKPGMGKSGIHRLILEHVRGHKNAWEVLGFNQNRLGIDYAKYDNMPGIVSASSLESFMPLLRNLNKELEERRNMARYASVELTSKKAVLPQDQKSIILLIEEMDFFDTPIEIDPTDPDAILHETLRAEAMVIIARLLALGSQARIHVVITRTDYTGSKNVLIPKDKDLRISLGNTDEESSFNIFGSNVATVINGPVGRGYSKVKNEEGIFQLYYTK